VAVVATVAVTAHPIGIGTGDIARAATPALIGFSFSPRAALYEGQEPVAALRTLVDELNLVTRDEVDELELRVAQLEHRLRLLEQNDVPS